MPGSIRAIVGFLIVVGAVVASDINVGTSLAGYSVIALIGAVIMAAGIEKIAKNINF